MARATFVTIMSACLLAAASTSPARAGAEESGQGKAALAGTSWTLQALGAEPVPVTPSVTLHFGSDGQVSGSDGCNQYQGGYSAGAGAIQFARDVAATLMACPDPVEARARGYLAALQRAARFDADDTRLELRDANGRLLVTFVASIRSPVHSAWDVIAYNNGKQAVVSLMAGTRVSMRFGDDGRLVGFAGCNQYFATYQLDGPAMSIGMVGTTRKFCGEPDGVMQQEALYLEALRSTSTFRLDGDRLELRAADGALAATLHRSAGK